MLILMRKPGESLLIGDDVTVTVLRVRDKRVHIGVTAPKELRVDRQEVRDRAEQEGADVPGDPAESEN